jgi:periplasmic protein TonB
MAYVEIYPAGDPREVLRWTFCAAAVLLAHALVLLTLWAGPDDAEPDAGAPVVLIELAPIAVAPPAPERDLAPGPEPLQAESERAREATPEEKLAESEHVPEVTPVPDAVVTLPAAPEPPKEPVRREAKQEPAEATPAAPVPTAPPAAVAPARRPASPSLGRVSRPSAAMVSWQRSLVAQIERHKRYPPHAHSEQGVAKLAFRLDRGGRVVTSRIAQSSGSAALDEETLALIKRAQPFPAPPPDLADDQLSFVVPIRYAASTRR